MSSRTPFASKRNTHHKNENICVVKIVFPVRSYFGISTLKHDQIINVLSISSPPNGPRGSPKSHTFKFKLFDVIDFMLNPAVGVVMLGVSSFASCFRIVVLPELSSPNSTILNSLSDDDLSFLKSDRRPCVIGNI